MRRICVYCGSNPGRNPAYADAAKELAGVLVRHEIQLVYGGADKGIMGVLANAVLERGGQALSPRGELFTADNIKARLTMRDLMESLRASGVDAGGQDAFGHADRKAFADRLDRILAQQH